MVTFLFIFWTLASVLLTLNVFRPLAKRSNSSFRVILVSFVLSWLVGDLLPHWILLNAGILILFSYSEIYSQPLGWGGLLVHFSGWTILMLRLWIMLNLPERLEQQMEAYLGAQWQKIYPSPLAPRRIFEVDWHSWFNPNKVIDDPRIEIIRDQVFHQQAGFQLKLDIYRPHNTKKKHPGILQIHGGAWITGSKRQASFLMSRMAARGWVCFSVSYRFSPDIVFPEHLIDVKHALRWIRNNAEEHGLDPDFIITTGGSSGGHLAAMTALTQNQSEFQPGFEKTDTSIQGCVPFYGVFNFSKPFDERTPFPAKAGVLQMLCGGTPETQPDRYQQITPANWISGKTPPFLLIQGETDALISATETQAFWEVLQAHKVKDSVFLRLPLVEHAFDIFPTLTAQCIVPTIERYLIMLHQNHLYNSGEK
ncbi:MAG: alpha/beta hydrolase [SAR324 cluster bacterium]|nr:alpha/beta hydrolase [SAR324 cluster bacterium]